MDATRKPRARWTPLLPVLAYRMVRLGLSLEQMRDSLGCSKRALEKWRKEHPELDAAMTLARQDREEAGTWSEWVYRQLPAELRLLWDKIREWENAPGGQARIALMLQDAGKHVRQQLFLHALCERDFSPSWAMASVQISKATLNRWVEDDPEFALLVDEIQWHKANFFEEGLVKLVKGGNAAAVIFANKTVNKDRGYAPSLRVHHEGTVQHAVLDLAALLEEIKPELREELLTALRRIEERKKVVTPLEMIEAEVRAVGS